jgi:hypothetical protein
MSSSSSYSPLSFATARTRACIDNATLYSSLSYRNFIISQTLLATKRIIRTPTRLTTSASVHVDSLRNTASFGSEAAVFIEEYRGCIRRRRMQGVWTRVKVSPDVVAPSLTRFSSSVLSVCSCQGRKAWIRRPLAVSSGSPKAARRPFAFLSTCTCTRSVLPSTLSISLLSPCAEYVDRPSF